MQLILREAVAEARSTSGLLAARLHNGVVCAGVVLALAVIVLYAPVVFLGRTLQAPMYYPMGITDSGAYGYAGRHPANVFDVDLATPAYYEWPINQLVGNTYRQGELPLWNPYQGTGTPLAAQYNTRAFFPYQILIDLLPVKTWDFLFLGRLWLAGLFTYLFLRALTLSWRSSIVGAFLYMFSGTFVWFINLEELVNVAMVTPLLLWSVEALWLCRWTKAVPMLGIAAALVLLGGQPETALFVLLLGAAYAVFRMALTPASERLWKGFLCGLGCLIGLLIASPLILDFLEFERRSHNFHPAGGSMGVQSPAKLLDAVSIVLPTFYQRQTFIRELPLNGRWDYLGGYVGMSCALLTALALFIAFARPRTKLRPQLLFFSAFGVLVLLKDFGFPFVDWIGHLPLLDQAWSPRWAGPAWTFPFAVSGALGLELLGEVNGLGGITTSRPWKEAARAFRNLLSHPAAFGWLVVALALMAVNVVTLLGFRGGSGVSILSEIIHSPFFFPSVVVGALVAGILALAMILVFRRYAATRQGVYGLHAIVLLDLWFAIPWGFGPRVSLLRLIPVAVGLAAVGLYLGRRNSLAVSTAAIAVVAFLGVDALAAAGLPLRYDPATPAPYVSFLQRDTANYRLMGGYGVLMPNFASAVGLHDVRYINSMTDAAFHRYRDRLLQKTRLWPDSTALWFTGNRERLDNVNAARTEVKVDFMQEVVDRLPFYSLLGVRYLLAPASYQPSFELSASGLRLVYDREVKIYENPRAAPRAFVVHRAEWDGDWQHAQDAISRPGFDPLSTAIVGGAASFTLDASATSSESFSDSSASITHESPNSLTVAVSTRQPGLLVVTDTFAPGWQATLDGITATVYQVDGLFRGVVVPAGDSIVRLDYRPAGVRIGIYLASAALLTCLLLLLASLMHNKKRAQKSDEFLEVRRTRHVDGSSVVETGAQ